MPYFYDAFGLKISSEFEIPQLSPGNGSPANLTICYGGTPAELPLPQAQGKHYQIGAEQFLLNIPNVARYLVNGGREIIVEPCPQAELEVVRLFLLGSAFGALLHQRGFWPLHGSAIGTSGGAVIFVGESGNGKSTLAGAFYQRGYQVLSDDVCAISFDREVALMWPAYPRIHLWADALEKFGGELGDYDARGKTLDKYEYPLRSFDTDAVQVRSIYALYVSQQAEIRLTPLKGFDKIKELTSNTYRLQFLTGMHLEQQHFQHAQTLARQARVVRVTRPQQPFLLDELVDLIERDFSP